MEGGTHPPSLLPLRGSSDRREVFKEGTHIPSAQFSAFARSAMIVLAWEGNLPTP